ncbi:MAG TPA: InlB B-repeat-containing protein, partial [Methanocorpusculum sp.]|nr:InlB B-repeat-containing protein [Methanocorpusculum sp.]
NAFRVLFDTQGGSFISPVTYLSYGDKISQPPAPTKDGYTFGGWYKDSACTQGWSFSEGIPGDMTLYAKWTATAGAQSGSSQQTVSQSGSTPAQQTAKATPAATQAQSTSAATAAAPSGTAASGSGTSSAMTQAPAPVLGALLGLLAAGVLVRRRD